MFKEYLEELRVVLNSEDFRETYTSFLKIFNEFDKNNLFDDNQFIEFFKIIKFHCDKLVFHEKAKLMEESITEIYQNAELLQDSDYEIEKTNRFFKKQIHSLITREIPIFVSFLKRYPLNQDLVDIIHFFFKNLQIRATEQLLLIFEYYGNGNLSKESFLILLEPIFDKYTKETLNNMIAIIKNIQGFKTSTKNIEILNSLFSFLIEQSDIYPDLFIQEMGFLIETLKEERNLNAEYRGSIGKIIMNIVQNRHDMFVGEFFNILEKSHKILQLKCDNLSYFLETSINLIYSNHSFQIFEYFYKELQEDYSRILDLISDEDITFKDLIFEFLIDYLDFKKAYEYKGKITKELLENYVHILEILCKRELFNEYFLFSLINQLKLEKFEYSTFIEGKDADILNTKKDDLKDYYAEIISEINNNIKIIFGK